MSELEKWQRVRLGDITSKPQYGYTTKSDATGDVRYLRTTDLTSGKVNWETVPFCVDKPDDVKKYQLEDDDIVISRAGSVGFHSLIKNPPENAVFASYLIRFKPSERVHPRYLSHFLNSKDYWQQITDKAAGVAVQNVNAQKLADLTLPLASLDEQKRIVDKLDAVLAKVGTAQARLDKIPIILKRFRQSVLTAATSGELTKDWRKDKAFNIKNELKQIVESRQKSFELDSKKHFERTGKKLRKYDFSNLEENLPVRNIPKEWEVAPLGNLISFLTDYHANGSYKVLKKHVQLKEDVDFACMIRATNFEKNNFDDLLIYITEEAYEFLGKSKLYGGEILIGKIGNAGFVYHMPHLNRPASLAMNLFSLRFDETLISSKYVYYFLKSFDGERNIQQYVRGVATKSIDKISLRSVFINLPSFQEQLEIVKKTEELFIQADLVEKKYKAAKIRVDKMTQSILARAFSGKLFSPISEDYRSAINTEALSSQSQHTKPEQKKATQDNKKEQLKAIDKKPEPQPEVVTEKETENNEQTSEVFQLLKTNRKNMSAQALFDSVSDNTFIAIDDVFSELKKLIEKKVVMQIGEGISSTFKVAKK